MMSPRLAAVVAAAVALTLAACAPPSTRSAGLSKRSTDIVLGGQTKPTTPPPVPESNPQPGFPSFLVPGPPPTSFAAVAPSTTVTTRPRRVPACPQADVAVIPEPTAVDVTGPPAAGTYPYRQSGTFAVGGAVRGMLPAESDRTVADVVSRSDGTFSYTVAVEQFGTVTTSTYELVRRSGQRETDGIYLTRVVARPASGSPEEFTPVPPGLRIFPLPAASATTWSSVATDPVRATSITLDGAIREPGRVDACGTVVEGWLTQATLTVRRAGTPQSSQDMTIRSQYVLVPKLGGLVVGIETLQQGTDRGQAIRVETQALINRLTPTTQPRR